MPKRRETPARARVKYYGVPYWLDLRAFRRALVGHQVRGELPTVQALADACGLPRSTVSRFLNRGVGSIKTARRITEALGLDLDQALTPVDEGG